MKTKRLIGTITYNTPMWLAVNMPKWVDSGICDWAHWIRHEPETDETKAHYHLIMMPAKTLDTGALTKLTYEIDPGNPEMCLHCQPWRFSKLDDWILYCLHDPNYLASKGQSRDLHYKLSDIDSTCHDLLEEQYRQIDLRRYGIGEKLKEMIKAGKDWDDVLISGLIPWAQIRYWKEVFRAMGGCGIRGTPNELGNVPF